MSLWRAFFYFLFKRLDADIFRFILLLEFRKRVMKYLIFSLQCRHIQTNIRISLLEFRLKVKRFLRHGSISP